GVSSDFGAFMRPIIANEQTLGHGMNCLQSQEYDISSSATCNIVYPSQSGTRLCGLSMVGHGIFFQCPSYNREAWGAPQIAPGAVPCVIKYTGTTTITCL